MTDPMPPDLPDKVLANLAREVEHVHYFRRWGTSWRCECGEYDHMTCRPGNYCPECEADMAQLSGQPDPYAAIARCSRCQVSKAYCRCGGAR